jgi:hypothetical protein
VPNLGQGREPLGYGHWGQWCPEGTANARTFDRSVQCGYETQGNGSNLLTAAEAKAEETKAEVG